MEQPPENQRTERKLAAILAADVVGFSRLMSRDEEGTLNRLKAHLGRSDDARAAWQGLLEVNPTFSLEQRAQVLPYKDSSDFDRIAEGLAKAGLP